MTFSQPTSVRPQIETTRLCAGHRGVPVVRDLDLTVGEGEVVALLGPNGAGKSTILLTIAGALPLLGGDVKVLGQSVRGQHVHEIARRGLALVPEDRGLFGQLSVAEHLRIGARPRSPISTDDVLDFFPPLRGLLGRRCGLLSGGEQQMLAIARVLVSGPRVLMIDEMSLGLAPVVVQRLLPLIRRIASEHSMGVLLVEQHVELALRFADRAYVLSNGGLALHGDVEHVRSHREVLEASYLGQVTEPGPSADDSTP